MKLFYHFLISSILLGAGVVKAQTLSITSTPQSICLGSPFRFNYSSTTTYAADNRFYVEVNQTPSNEGAGKSFIATVQNGSVEATLPVGVISTNTYDTRTSIRLVSTNPVSKSAWVSVEAYQPPVIQLYTQKVNLDLNDALDLKFSVSGKLPISLILKDTLSGSLFPHTISINNSYTQPFDHTFTTAVSRSRSYVIQSATNECGTGSGQGKVDLTVNSFSVKLISVSPAVVCTGATVLANYQITNGSMNRSNTFRAELTSYDSYTNQEGAFSTTVQAQAETNGVRFTVPAQLSPGEYRVRILTSDPVAKSTFSSPSIGYFRVSPAPSTKISSESKTIDYGESAVLTVDFTGNRPFVAYLQDGTLVKNTLGDDENRTSVAVQPQQSTTYTVRNFFHGCGPAEAGSGNTTINVRKGIQADSIPKMIFCGGTSVRIPVRANFDPTGTVSVRLINSYGSLTTPLTVSGEIKNNVLTFLAPVIPAKSDLNEVRIEVTGKEFTSRLAGTLHIGSLPHVDASPTSYVMPYAGPMDLEYHLFGYGPYELTFEDGEKYVKSDPYHLGYVSVPVYPFSSKVYRVKSITNRCGTSSVNSAVNVTVNNPVDRGIELKPLPYYTKICRNKPLNLTFNTKGNFEANNRFRIMYREAGETTVIKEVGSAGEVEVSIEAVARVGSSGLYIESTNPVVQSNLVQFELAHLPIEPRLQWQPESRSVIKGESLKARITFNTSTSEPYHVIWSDGQKEVRSELYSWEGEIRISPEASTTFTLKAVGNQCGTFPITNVSAPLEVNHTRVLFSSVAQLSFLNICKNVPVELPYALEGVLNPEATFDVQVVSRDEKEVVEIAKNLKGNPLRFNWPQGLDSEKDWSYLRVVSSNYKVTSGPLYLRLLDTPQALLSTMDGSSQLTYSDDESARRTLKLSLRGGSPWQVNWSDGMAEKYENKDSYRYLSLLRGGVFSLQSVSNQCGYGSASGQVTVKVPPSLSLQSSTVNVCAGSRVQVSYTSSGDFTPNNYFRLVLLNPQGKIIARLDSSSLIRHQFSPVIPSSVPTGSYYLEIQSSDTQKQSRSSVVVRNVPRMVLGSNVSVPAGTAAVIRLQNQNPASNSYETIQYTLSDGTSGVLFENQSYKDFSFTPAQTTTYRALAVSNSCGVGSVRGSATVTVENPSAKEIQIIQIQTSGKFSGLCSGDTVHVNTLSKGSLSPQATYQVLISDTTGTTFTALTTGGSVSRLWALIPATLTRSDFYRLKVLSSESGVYSRTFVSPLSLRFPATASFLKETMALSPENTEPVLIQFTGDGPWQYQIGNEMNPSRTLTASTNPFQSYSNTGTPTDRPAVYKLYSVSNVCGTGKILNPSTLRVEIITSTAPPQADVLKVYPNPTQHWIRVEGTAPFRLRLMNLLGATLLEKDSRDITHQLDLSSLPAGAYLLEVTTNDQRTVYRVIKE